MALNTNIALGVQPIQQPQNMLGQYAQIMAIKAAQQETEGYEGVKSAIAGGMDAADPRMLQYGKRGIDAFKAAGEGRVKQQDALTKAYANQKRTLAFVSTPDDLLAHGLSQFNDPVIAPQLKAQGLTPEKLTASFQKQLATEGFESLLKKRAMGLDDWYKDQTSRRNTDVSAGPSYMNAQLNREKFNLERQNQKSIQNVLADQVGPQGEPPSNVNALAGGGDVQQRVAQIDARIEQLVSLGTPDALRAADVLFKQRNAISPSTGAVPGSIQEFNLAKQQGYAGTFMDFKKDKAALNSFGQPIEVARTLPDGSTVVEMVYPNPVQGTMTPLSNLTTPAAPPTAAADASGSTAPVQKPATVAKITVNNSELNRVTTAIDQTIATINNIIGDPSKKTGPAPGLSSATGPIMSRLPTTRTETANVEADMLSLESKASILGLRDIRKDAAVGSITEKEWPRFEGYLAALARSQGTSQYIERAKEFRTYLEGIKKQAVESTNKANKALGGGAAAPQTPANTGDINVDPDIQSLLDKYK
jgi:hypothetical protein